MKKLFLILLVSALFALLAACTGANEPAPATPAPEATPPPADTAEEDTAPDYDEEPVDPYAIDLSEFVTVNMLHLGDRPADMGIVQDAINELLLERINAKIEFDFMSVADMATMYSLRLAAGGPLDLIYTSSWANYSQEATRGAFLELTPEMLSRYMPMTYERQPWISFEQAMIQGRIYMVPANSAPLAGNMILIREDLRLAHDLPEVVCLETFESFLQGVADNELGVFPYFISQHNDLLKAYVFNTRNNIVGLPGSHAEPFFGFRFTPGMTLTSDDIVWLPGTPEYLEFALMMHDWADRGFWPRGALADQTAPRDAFENATSGSFIHNSGTVGVIGNTMAARDIETLGVDIFPDSYRFFGLFIGDGIAVPASSENWQRAMMALDHLKFDYDVFALYRWGVEGLHWTAIDDTHWDVPDPDAQARYVFGAASWGIRNAEFERSRVGGFESSSRIFGLWTDNMSQHSPSAGFVFDISELQTEMANLSSAQTRHMPVIDLGFAPDPEAALEAFTREAYAAGLERIMEELRRQLDEFLAGY